VKPKILLAVCEVGTVVGFVGSCLGLWIVKQQDERYEKLWHQSEINYRVLEQFFLRADPELAEAIKSEFEFEVITRDLH